MPYKRQQQKNFKTSKFCKVLEKFALKMVKATRNNKFKPKKDNFLLNSNFSILPSAKQQQYQ